jgi:hypothetical protein
MVVTVNTDIDSIMDGFDDGLIADLLAERILFDTNEFVPMDSGALMNSGKVKNGVISWTMPYASIMYYSENKMRTAGNVLATSRWFEVSRGVNNDEWVKLAKYLIIQSIKGEDF